MFLSKLLKLLTSVKFTENEKMQMFDISIENKQILHSQTQNPMTNC